MALPIPATAPPDETALEYLSLSEVVVDWLARQIISGALEPGTRLVEAQLARSLNVSRSPIREALRKLSTEGLVEVSPRRGSYVATFDADTAADLYDSRLILEPACYGLAARSIADDQIHELDAIVAKMEEAVESSNSELYLQLDVAYHRRLGALCPNRVLVELLDTLWHRSVRYRHIVLRLPDRPALSFAYHSEVQQAIRRRDEAGVANVTRALLLDSKRVLLETLPQSRHSARSPEPT